MGQTDGRTDRRTDRAIPKSPLGRGNNKYVPPGAPRSPFGPGKPRGPGMPLCPRIKRTTTDNKLLQY